MIQVGTDGEIVGAEGLVATTRNPTRSTSAAGISHTWRPKKRLIVSVPIPVPSCKKLRIAGPRIAVLTYGIDDETAIGVVEGTIDVISEARGDISSRLANGFTRTAESARARRLWRTVR